MRLWPSGPLVLFDVLLLETKGDEVSQTQESQEGHPVLVGELLVNRQLWRRNRAAILEGVRGVLTDMAREVTRQPGASFEVKVLGTKPFRTEQGKLETRLRRRPG